MIRPRHHRRGVVVVQVAIGLLVILGFAALGVDVGLMYATKADLQKVADAAALAAASQLGNFAEAEAKATTVTELARQAALAVLKKNEVLGHDIVLEEGDILYGHSIWNEQDSTWDFEQAGAAAAGVNAVRIIARRTEGSSNGAVNLFFGGVLGLSQANIDASATAILVPRDIIIVADLSGSYNDDSQFQNYASNDPGGINLYEVWQTLPRSSADGIALQAWLDANPGMTVQDAPSSLFEMNYGFFSKLGSNNAGSVPVFGQTVVNSSYNPGSDDGLVRLTFKAKWNSAGLGAANYGKMRTHLLGMGYSDNEVRCIMADTPNSATNTSIINADSTSVSYTSEYSTKLTYDLRAAVALGLVYWNSGMPGGLWQSQGWSPGSGNWGMSMSEMVPGVAYPFPSGNWFEYAAYTRDTNNVNWAVDSLPSIKHMFGAKTFVNFVLEEKELNSETDVTHFAYAMPLHLTKNSLDVLMDDVVALDSGDRVGLVTYGTTAVLEYPLPAHDVTLEENAADIKSLYRHRQAAHYSPATNIGQGVEFGTQELTSSRARPSASKVIVLLTDGMANIDASGNYDSSGSTGIAYALEASETAWSEHHVRIHAVGVGSQADMDTLNEIAVIGQTSEAYWANGDFAEIQAELNEIFHAIGGLRPVQMID